MAVFQDSYLGIGVETVYGTAVPATQFFEFNSEGVSAKYERIESSSVRAGNQVLRHDRWAVNPKGAEGDIKLEVLDAGFEGLLKMMLGAATAGTPAAGYSTTTATLGDLKGDSFTLAVGRVDTSGVLTPFTYSGGKVKSWEFSNAVDGILELTLDADFAAEGTPGGTAATPTYATGSQLFTFTKASVTIGGTAFAASDISVKGDNALKTDRYALRGATSTTKREPLTEELRTVEFDIKGEFEGLTHYNRFRSATEAGAVAAIVATWASPQGGELSITIPAGRFDEAPVNTDGAKVIEQSMSGKALTPATGEPITIAYKAKTAA